MSQVGSIKNQIAIYLNDLVTAGTLGQYIVDDYKKGVFQRDYAKYPCAILTTPSIDSEIESGIGNRRKYTFDVIVIMLGDNITTTTFIEDLQELILDKFDTNATLNNTAQRSEANVSVPAAVVSAGGKHFVLFGVTIKAERIKDFPNMI